ncbi:MAG TPA: hypothetical protein VNW99_11940 [Cytophagaceae bacterium]|nr:hypothetical protein [Cytophagaceae bacterium]
MNKKILIIVLLTIGVGQALRAQTVFFNGLGRAIVTNDRLKGPVLNGGSTLPKDTTSARNSTGGYTLFDLGVNIQPNESFRGSVILRVRNEFGAFYGQGASLAFRQLRIEGLAGKKVKYQLGDIDMGLTPYTIFNPDEVYHDYEADIFGIRRKIVHYENFNYGNKWRVQGGDVNTNLIFTRGIEKIKFRLFGARIKKNNQLANIPDRVFYGGRLEVVQSKYLQLGGNLINTTDLQGTVPDTLYNFKDEVVTGDYRFTLDMDKIILAAYGELGYSNYVYNKKVSDTTVKHNDYFYDLGISGAIKPLGIKLIASYRNIGSGFFSPVAQTRRIFDYGTPTIFGNLQNVNDPNSGSTRIPTLFDRYSQEGLYNPSISTVLMPFLPQYNNVTPYGPATPNRKGVTFSIEKSDTAHIFKADVKTEILSEIVGEGTAATRKFLAARGGFSLNINKIVKFKRSFGITFGARYEHTTRATSSIDLSSLLLDAGLNFEVIKNLDLLVGYKLLNALGNEYLSQRNSFNNITGTPLVVNINQQQGIWALGGRYNFNNNAFFTIQGHMVHFNNNKNNTLNYNMNQLFFNYTIVF